MENQVNGQTPPPVEPTFNNPNPYNPQQPFPYPQQQSNTPGLLGFIFSLVVLVLGWIPFVGIFAWIAGLVLSIVGLQRQPKGLAKAGLIISIITFVIAVIIIVAVFAFAGWFVKKAAESGVDLSDLSKLQ